MYVQVSFCERLCWSYACHTQGTRTLAVVEAYLDMLEREIAAVAARLPTWVRMGRLHWGGGTPTILPPVFVHRIAGAWKAALPPAPAWEFSVEIDPTMADAAKTDALAWGEVMRASIGIEDFGLAVQASIGRAQSFEATRS
jgi:oxygen-independent coproporphyrinogen-3 oxidase